MFAVWLESALKQIRGLADFFCPNADVDVKSNVYHFNRFLFELEMDSPCIPVSGDTFLEKGDGEAVPR